MPHPSRKLSCIRSSFLGAILKRYAGIVYQDLSAQPSEQL